MTIRKSQWIGMGLGLIIIVFSLFFMNSQAFFFIFGIGIVVAMAPFVVTTIYETKIAAEKEEMFLEFTRNLVESVKTGTPISKSIINLKKKSYGILGENIEKLANQISMGIPLGFALQVFAKDVNNKTISRALALIGQAEKAGGDIGEILEAVTEAVSMSDRLKKERKATISTLVVQGYIIFFVFMVIVLVMQFKILPLVEGISTAGIGNTMGLGVGSGGVITQEEISGAFFYLLLIQGFFSGLTIGKLSEGNIKPGIKHSFILMLAAFLISTGANLIF